MAITPNGLLLVAEFNSQTIAVVGNDGQLVNSFQHQGGGCPISICITPDNHILVLSSQAPHIAKYAMDYKLVRIVNTSNGNGPLQFASPQGIAVTSNNGRVYICDTRNHCVQVLNSDLTFNHMIVSQFNYPCGIAIDSQDALYVCDYGNHRVQKLSSDGTAMSVITPIPHPRCVAIGHNDRVYIIDESPRLFIHDSDGYNIGSQESNGKNGLAVDKKGHICVSDGDSIAVFSGYF